MLAHRGVRQICLWVVLVGTVTFLSLMWRLEHSNKKLAQLAPQFAIHAYESTQTWSCPEIGGGARGTVLTVFGSKGRLGNHIWEYLSVWALARRYGMHPAIPAQTLVALRRVFKEVSLPSLEEVNSRCGLDLMIQYNAAGQRGNFADNRLRSDLSFEPGKNVSLLTMQSFVIHIPALTPYWLELRRVLHIRAELQAVAQRKLMQIRRLVQKRQHKELLGEMEYIGVHVRRTDYTAYIARRHPGATPADHNFYLRAMQEMRSRLKSSNLVFIVVSDDLGYVNKHLATSGRDVVVAGNGDLQSPGHDLALLAACNHTIFAYGTFGFSAAMYNAEGITILYDPKPNNSTLAYLKLAKQLPNWIVL